MRTVRVHRFGGPEVLELEEVATPQPGHDEVRVGVHAAGVNFVDINYRKGIGKYRGNLPVDMGVEGAGVVEVVGSGVSTLRAGDRVAWTGVLGSYATHVIVSVDRLVPLPATITFEQGAAAMLQGLTARYLSHSAYRLNPGDTCLVHAGAGGVGLLLCQMAKMRRARVLATVSTPAKAELARAAGADETILYSQQDFVAEVRRLTDGRGVNVVYDSVGKDTFEKGLDCLARRGVMILYGQASGPVPPIEALTLNVKGSLSITWPSLFDYIETRADLLAAAEWVLTRVETGQLRLRVHGTFPLAAVAEAHHALENRASAGKLLLTP
jgi:NADPH2:quinone reductase